MHTAQPSPLHESPPPQPEHPVPRKRLLVLTSTFPRWEGDSEPPFVFELSRRLAVDMDVWVLAPHAPGARQSENLGGMTIIRYRYAPQRLENLAYEGGITAKLKHTRLNYLLVPFFMFGQWLALRRLLREVRFDAIHAHWLIPQGIVATLGLSGSPRPPLLCTSHGGDLFGLRGRLLSRIKRFVLHRAAHVTVVSHTMQTVARTIAGAGPRIDVIPMGADIRTRFIPPDQARRPQSLLFVGRIVEKKGLAFLLQALPPLCAEFPQLHLKIAGDGPERSAMETLAQRLGIAERISFLGRTPNDRLPALYQESEIVVFPSVIATDGDQEGFPVVPMEALGCACALVACAVPGTEDFLRDGDTALVVPQRDPVAITARLRALLGDAQLRDRLGRQGRESVLRDCDWSAIATRYRRVLDALPPPAN